MDKVLVEDLYSETVDHTSYNMDISKCENKDCPLSVRCLRFTCKPNEYRQSYAKFEPKINNGKVECDYFIKEK
jgi:hypothetical protein